MALNFPSAPNTGDLHTVGSIIWKYNGKAWDSLYEPSAPAQVGLSNVDNTSDEDKPVSTAQQAALDALTKDDVGLDNVDNTSDINKPVSTAQQAAIDAAGGGGSSFDQDLNTTDSPTFATLTTTDTISTDVYTVDVGATGTVTADSVDVNYLDSPTGVLSIRPSGIERFRIANTKMNGGSTNTFGWSSGVVSSNADTTLGRASAGVVEINAGAGSLELTDLDATGTVTAGDVAAEGAVFNAPTVGSDYVLNVQSSGARNFSVNGFGTVESKTMLPRANEAFNFGASSQRWGEVFTKDLDATGTVKKGVYTVATLPTGEAGMTCFVSDANATTRGSTVAGGGANFMPVYSDGTNWIIS
jgi:hypothetical protein